MISMRDVFTRKAAAATAQVQAKDLHQVTQEIADGLVRDIIERIYNPRVTLSTGQVDAEIIFELPDSCNITSVKNTKGYTEIHDVCAEDSVDVKVETRKNLKLRQPPLNDYYEQISIVITLNRPYQESPDAGFINKPRAPAPPTL